MPRALVGAFLLVFLSHVDLVSSQPCSDWLLCGRGAGAGGVSAQPWSSGALSGVTLTNGLISRQFLTSASGAAVFATLDYTTHLDDPLPGAGQSLLRSLSAEASLTLRGAAGALAVGGVDVAGRAGPPAFTLLANNSAAQCALVAQGPVDGGLARCLAACWAAGACNLVDWIAPVNGSGADCVLKACAAPLAPPLQPYAGCAVYATAAAARPSLLHGAALNRSGLDAPGVLQPLPGALLSTGWATAAPVARFAWAAGRRGSPAGTAWPPDGLTLRAGFTGAPGTPLAGANVSVVYEMYADLPVLVKWVEVSAGAAQLPAAGTILDGVELEHLGLAPPFAQLAPLAYADQFTDSSARPRVRASSKLHVLLDLHYAGWVNYTDEADLTGVAGSSQPVLSIAETPPLSEPLAAGRAPWRSARAYELLLDDGPEQGAALPLYPSSESYWGCTLGPCTPGVGAAMEGGFTERRGLALRRLIAAIAPQGLESPLQNHISASDSASLRAACDASAATGFEMVVMSYGSGFDAESADSAYRARVAADVAHCRAAGIEVGGYDLIGWTRDPGRGWAALAADGSDTGDACFASGWEAFLGAAFLDFAAATGVTVFETDGPYAGYSCSNASHAGHAGAGDSVARQSRNMAALYSALQSAGIFVNAPDTWLAFGASRLGIGYNEGTFRLQDLDLLALIQRQVIFDATFYTVPSMAWSQVPPASAYNLSEPADAARFELALAGQLTLGITASVYDARSSAGEGGDVYRRWLAAFKAQRTLLATGDVIHVRRPDGQALDVVVRARAGLPTPAAVLVTNPTADDIAVQQLTVPLYYSGLPAGAAVSLSWLGGAQNVSATLDARARLVLTSLAVPARTLAYATVTLR